MAEILRLKPKLAASADKDSEIQHLDIDHQNIRLPCRFYEITFQQSQMEGLPLVSELLLRLVKALGQINETDVSEFFGFNFEETAYAIHSLKKHNYIDQDKGQISINQTGKSLFKNSGDGLPVIYDISSDTRKFCFDMISKKPAGKGQPFPHAAMLNELRVPGENLQKGIKEEIKETFKKSFVECLRETGKENPENSFLYSISSIETKNRASNIIPVSVTSETDFSGINVNLLSWKSGYELEERISVLTACSQYIKQNNYAGLREQKTGHEFLRRCSPKANERFFSGTSFNTELYLENASSAAGELRKDRPTVRIFGTLWVQRNFQKILTALNYSKKLNENPVDVSDEFFWLRPNTTTWGKSSFFLELLEKISSDLSSEIDNEPIKCTLLSPCEDNENWKFKDVFDKILKLEGNTAPGDFELLYVPGKFFAANIYRQLNQSTQYHIPCGIISFDQELMSEAKSILLEFTQNSAVSF